MSANTDTEVCHSVEPPRDGTVIFATGNVMYQVPANEDELDSPAIGIGADHFEAEIFWDENSQEWLSAANRLTVRQCYSDEIYFHWWTALEAA